MGLNTDPGSEDKTFVGTRTLYIPEGEHYKVLMVSRLSVLRGPDKGMEFTVERERVTIGRSRRCDLTLSDKAVSSLHAELVTEQSGRVVRDLDSRNGISFSGHKVGDLDLQQNTRFSIGNNMMLFEPLDEQLKIHFSPRDRFGMALGRSVRMREIFAVLEKVAVSDISLLLRGETGTGKELIASAVHEYSLRKNRPFVVFDCGSASSESIESVLFGHEKGAFTGAEQRRQGVFEQADGGTLYLDGVAELDPALQPKLLRALQQKEIKRLGGLESIPVDVRVIASTQVDLRVVAGDSGFREDLFYRLSGCEVELPPLRERIEDIQILAEHFLEEGNQVRGQLGLPAISFDEDAFELLNCHAWPGNVRELRNLIERLGFTSEETVLGRAELEPELFGVRSPLMATDLSVPYKQAKARVLERFERHYLSRLMENYNGNLSQAAKAAGLVRHHLRGLCQRYGIRCGADAPASGKKK